MDEIDIAVIGAGPHGLAAAAHLRRAGVDCLLLGDPMSFWREMPAGMLLRSNWTATSHSRVRRTAVPRELLRRHRNRAQAADPT